jgi:hypothetical protein
MLNGKITPNDELKRTWIDVVVAYFKIGEVKGQ